MTKLQFAFVMLSVLAINAAPASAQACHGTPRRGGVAYEYGKLSGIGTSQGVAGALAGSHVALGAGAAVRDLGTLTGQEASLRFSFILGGGNLQICPGLGFIYQHDSWSPREEVSLTAHNLLGRAGAGIGYEQRLFQAFSITPFVVAQYEFGITAYDLAISTRDSTSTDISGDTLSRAQFEYGLIGRYKFLYGGVAALRSSDSNGGRPDMMRFIVGVTFGGGPVVSKAPVPARRTTTAVVGVSPGRTPSKSQ
jgi:hypothetical protein